MSANNVDRRKYAALDPDCAACQDIAFWRAEHPQFKVEHPGEFVEQPKVYRPESRHPHLGQVPA